MQTLSCTPTQRVHPIHMLALSVIYACASLNGLGHSGRNEVLLGLCSDMFHAVNYESFAGSRWDGSFWQPQHSA